MSAPLNDSDQLTIVESSVTRNTSVNTEDNIPHVSPHIDDHSPGNITVSWNEKRFVLAGEIVSCGFQVQV